MYGILCMCTSYRCTLQSVAGETRKFFSTSLGEIRNKSASNYKNMKYVKKNWFKNDEKFFERAVSADSLKRAWFALRSKSNMPTKKLNSIFLNGINDAWFVKTNKKLLEGSFQYPIRKKVFIDKENNEKTLLTSVNLKIKVIEKALFNALEPQFEGYFSWENITKEKYLSVISQNTHNHYHKTIVIDNKILYLKKKITCYSVFCNHSYGFRPKKCAHQVLKNIKDWKTDTTFLIDYNISKVFDRANCKELKFFFVKRIKDFRFWNEIFKILYSGVLYDLRFIFKKKKVIQKSVLSSFLFNIYMDELDKKITSLRKSIHQKRKFYRNVIYKSKFLNKNERKVDFNFVVTNLKQVSKKTFTQIKKFVCKKSRFESNRWKDIGLEMKSIQYIRYADDFLIGIAGKCEFALQIRKYLNNFIKNNLYLEIKKDHLTNCYDKQIEFLGYFISFSEYKEKRNAISKRIRAVMKNKDKSISRFLKSDKRLAKAKSHQFYSNVLKQFEILSNKLEISGMEKFHTKVFARLIAYKGLSFQFLEILRLDNWEQLNELLSSIDFNKLSSKKNNNSALSRWSSYLQNEYCSTNRHRTPVLSNRSIPLITSKWYENFSKKQVKKTKHYQKDPLIKIAKIMKESLKFSTDKTSNKTISKFKTNISTKVLWDEEDNDFSHLTKKVPYLIPKKCFSKKVFINAPIDGIFVKLRLLGYIHLFKNKATNNFYLNFCTDFEIVFHFNLIICGLLNWHSEADNFEKVKSLVQLLRLSCVLTLANKHKKSKNWVYIVYGNKINVSNGGNKIFLISRSSILNHFNGFGLKMGSSCVDYYDLDKMIGRFNKLSENPNFHKDRSWFVDWNMKI